MAMTTSSWFVSDDCWLVSGWLRATAQTKPWGAGQGAVRENGCESSKTGAIRAHVSPESIGFACLWLMLMMSNDGIR